MITELLHYQIETLNDDGIWIHHSFLKPAYKYEDTTVKRGWWIFGYSITRQVCVNEQEARIRARTRALRKAQRLNQGIPTRLLITVRFRGHANPVTYEVWDRGRYVA